MTIKEIVIKIEMLETSLLGDDLCEEFNIALSLLYEPWLVVLEIEISYGVDIWAKKGFENYLTYVLSFIFIWTEKCHVENLNGRIMLDNLSK